MTVIRIEPRDRLEAASSVGRTYGLVNVCLVDVLVRRLVPAQEMDRTEFRYDVNTKTSTQVLEDGQTLVAQVGFQVLLRPAEPAENPTLRLIVEGTFELTLRKISEQFPTPSSQQAETFADINGVFMAWPYVRELVSSMFARVGYPALTLESLTIGSRPDAPTETEPATTP